MKSHFRRHQDSQQKLQLMWEQSLPHYRWEHLKSSFHSITPIQQHTPNSLYNWRSKGDEWFLSHIRSSDFLEIEDKDRALLAAQWLREGIFEQRSAESWNSLMLDLMARGAPLSLVRGCSRAFLDEIEHSRICYSLVKALSPEKLTFSAPHVGTSTEDVLSVTNLKNDEEFLLNPNDSKESRFQIAHKAISRGVWVQELASQFSITLSREKTYGTLVADLLKKSVDEHRHSDLQWDVFSWAMKSLGKEDVDRMWTLWSNHPKPKFQNLLVGEGRGRDISKEVRAELSERLKSFFVQNFGWQGSFETNSEKPLPISRPAS